MQRLRAFATNRAGLLAVAIGLALWRNAAAAAPPPRTPDGVAAALGASMGGVVAPEDIAWEPTSGTLVDPIAGRRVLFLGAARRGAPRDLFRARVRVVREGAPVVVRELRNLTHTPLGDEAGLSAVGSRASFATTAYGGVQAITVLDLDGDPSSRPSAHLREGVQRALSAYQRSGSLRGLGRTDLVFDEPPPAVDLELAPHLLSVTVEGRSPTLELDLESGQLRRSPDDPPAGVRAVSVVAAPKPFTLWAVDTARYALGPGPIAWVEDRVFSLAESLRRGAFVLGGGRDLVRRADAPGGAGPAAPPDPFEGAGDDWPPPNLPSMWQTELPGEGIWEPIEYPFLARVPGAQEGAPPYFQRTFIRPDPERPYSRLTLIALDMRQLELRVQAGDEDPKPLTGPPGTGRIPREGDTLERVVAAFNGAFKSDHGAYGMVVERRVLLPPVPGAATVLFDDRGRTGFGVWPASPTLPAEVVSLRQNLEPLLIDGQVNPTGRAVWGTQIMGNGIHTQRTALCLTPTGQIYYAFGAQIDAMSLGRGLRQAGCAFAVHLDMNPGHCGFVFADVVDMNSHRFELRRADPEMRIAPDKFVFQSAKDFFYVLVRDLRPAPIGDAVWSSSPGTQPSPANLPSVFTTRVRVGGIEVELTSLDAERVEFALRGGEREPRPLAAPPPVEALEAPALARSLVAIGLGATTAERPLGLSFHHAATLSLREDAASLVVSGMGAVSIVPPATGIVPGGGSAIAQLPLLVAGATLTPRAAEPGPLRERAALGTTPGGHLVIARATHDTSVVLAKALLLAGCDLVVELERGAQLPPVLHRAGTSSPPLARNPATVLHALDRPMRARAFRWPEPLGAPHASGPADPEAR